MNRLKELRQTFNLSQRDFAERVGMSRNTIADLEIERQYFTRYKAEQIAKQFKIETDWLLGASRVPVRRTIKPYVPPERPKIRIDDSYIWRKI